MIKFVSIILIVVLAWFVWSLLSVRVAVVDVSSAPSPTPTPSRGADVQQPELKHVPQIPITLTVGGITYDGIRWSAPQKLNQEL